MVGENQSDQTALRCRLIRTVIEGDKHGSIQRFARRIDVKKNRWYNVENGAPLSLRLATILVQKIYGLDFNYLFSGRTDGLTKAMFDRLDELERAYTKPSSKSDRQDSTNNASS